MDRIVISHEEVTEAKEPAINSDGPSTRLASPIDWRAKVCIWPLILALPVLCIVSVILRVIHRNSLPRVRQAWLSLLSTVLIVSGILTSIGFVLAFTLVPNQPSMVSQGLSDFDGRTSFPVLAADQDLSTEEIATKLKPLVTVITPAQRSWLSGKDSPSSIFGAGVLLQATKEGYLIATARHVVDGDLSSSNGQKALVASVSGTWATAEVIARHSNLDLLLLWLPRVEGDTNFVLPVMKIDRVKDGMPVFVIGHPQGLRFTLSTGIVSRKDQDLIQLTAPVSPGNSGGPMFDSRGELAGIVTSMVDRSRSPNAESLNFAVRADALLDITEWKFVGDGRRHLALFKESQRTIPAEKEK